MAPNGATALAEKKSEPRALPEPAARRGITEAQWLTLRHSLYPGARPESVILVWDYCQARRLDPLKKPCHIVPMEVKNAQTGKYEWRDVVMPGVYELRTTAHRTGVYIGHSTPAYGPEIEAYGVKAPEWCSMTVFRWNEAVKREVSFPVLVRFAEVVALTRDGRANSRWTRAPHQMLTKCCEAAGLREAFPDELGGQQTAEEMEGQRAVEHTPSAETPIDAIIQPDGFENWLDDVTAAADEGEEPFEKAWAASPAPMREYLNSSSPERWESLKARAAAAGKPQAEAEA